MSTSDSPACNYEFAWRKWDEQCQIVSSQSSPPSVSPTTLSNDAMPTVPNPQVPSARSAHSTTLVWCPNASLNLLEDPAAFLKERLQKVRETRRKRMGIQNPSNPPSNNISCSSSKLKCSSIPLFLTQTTNDYRDASLFAHNQNLAETQQCQCVFLELGCSTGENLRNLLRKGVPNTTLIGVDVGEKVLEECRRSFSDITNNSDNLNSQVSFVNFNPLTDWFSENPYLSAVSRQITTIAVDIGGDRDVPTLLLVLEKLLCEVSVTKTLPNLRAVVLKSKFLPRITRKLGLSHSGPNLNLENNGSDYYSAEMWSPVILRALRAQAESMILDKPQQSIAEPINHASLVGGLGEGSDPTGITTGNYGNPDCNRTQTRRRVRDRGLSKAQKALQAQQRAKLKEEEKGKETEHLGG